MNCTCPGCGSDVQYEEVDIEEFVVDVDTLARIIVCPDCGSDISVGKETA